ncbi:OmpA family protein [Brevundimonas sp.]|uniref:OmpA family protein n=1 Tax=Brevundimonas sp. TaxID=1871086 RepID=UPI003D0D428E
MRAVVAAGLLTALAACSSPEPEASAPAQVSAAPSSENPAADPTRPGGGLIGEVSSLSGEITAFRVSETARTTVVELAADVLFAFDKSDLSPQAPAQLQRAADLIRQGGPGPVRVVGYTDSHGEDGYNLALSQRRAASVVAWLGTTGGIDASRLVAEGRGEADPVAPNAGTEGNDYPEGRAMNRRVTITIPKA